MKLQDWQNVFEVQDFIEFNKIESSLFVANLDKIQSGKGIKEYSDPVLFFEQTYITKGLKKLLSGAFSRLLGLTNQGVFNLQTSFGGGKTHALSSLYHFFNSFYKLRNESIFSELLQEYKTKIPERFDPAVCAIVGSNLDVNSGRTIENNIKINTIWGELAYQLGGFEAYKIIESDDLNKTTPTKDILKKLFLQIKRPSLILMDEVLGYISNLDIIDKEWLSTTFEFFRRLPEVVNDEELKVVLVASLPESRIESQTERGEMHLTTLKKMIGREEFIISPIEGDEIYHIIRKRLFKPLNESKRNEITRICNRFMNLYKKFKSSMPEDLFSTISDTYEDRLELSYPFHPELVKVFYEKWNASESFQRTRYILHIFSLLIRSLKEKKNISIILPSHFDITESDIKTILLKFMGETYEGVIDTDIKRSQFLQEVIGEDTIKETNLAEKLFRVIFLHSFQVGTNPIGINEKNLNLSVLDDSGINPPLIEITREKMKNNLFYFFEENGKFLIKTEINLNAIIIDEKNKLDDEDIIENFKTNLNLILKKSYHYTTFPVNSKDIPDNPNINYILLDNSFSIALSKMHNLNPNIIEKLVNYTKKKGESDRVYKNGLIFILPEQYGLNELKDKIKDLLALKKIKTSEIIERLSATQIDDLEKRIKEINENLEIYYYNAYSIASKWIGNQKVQTWKIGQNGKSIQERVENTLINENLIFDSYFSGALAENFKEEEVLEKIWNQFFQIGDILLKDQDVLKRTIIQGVQRGDFAIGKLMGGVEEENFSNLKEDHFDKWLYKKKVSKKKVDISKEIYLIPINIAEQIIKNSVIEPPKQVDQTKKAEESVVVKEIGRFGEIKIANSEEQFNTSENKSSEVSISITSEVKKEELTELKLTIDFSWENLDLLMDIKTLLLLLGQKSESLKLNMKIDFKALTKISGMELTNIKKLFKEFEGKVKNIKIDSNINEYFIE